MAKRTSEIAPFLEAIDLAYDRRSWHGTNLRGSLRGVTATQAVWRPGPDRHNIAELAVHAAYWKYAVLRRLTGQKRGSFALDGSNWFGRSDDLSDAAWKADLALLAGTHRELRAEVAALPPARLRARIERTHTVAWLLSGIAAHDLYHAGQIQLIKKLRTQ